MVDLPVVAVVRFPGVKISRRAFETLLESPVDRFDPSSSGGAHYAQINLPDESTWDDLAELIHRIGPTIQPYLERCEIARPIVDAVLYFDDDKVSASLLIPHSAALAVGRWGFDLEVSAYLTSSA